MARRFNSLSVIYLGRLALQVERRRRATSRNREFSPRFSPPNQSTWSPAGAETLTSRARPHAYVLVLVLDADLNC